MKTSQQTHKHQREAPGLLGMGNTKDGTRKAGGRWGPEKKRRLGPYLKANERSTAGNDSIKSNNNKPPNSVSFAVQLLLQTFLFTVCEQACGQKTVCMGQLCTSTMHVTPPTSGFVTSAFPTEPSNHPCCCFETESPLLPPSKCWDYRPIHRAQLMVTRFLMF